jgi:hypothetical protein
VRPSRAPQMAPRASSWAPPQLPPLPKPVLALTVAGGRAWLGGECCAVERASARGESRSVGCRERVATELLWSSLAAAGGASGSHAWVTPTRHFPPPSGGERGWSNSRTNVVFRNHPHPNSPAPSSTPRRRAWDRKSKPPAHSKSAGPRYSLSAFLGGRRPRPAVLHV